MSNLGRILMDFNPKKFAMKKNLESEARSFFDTRGDLAKLSDRNTEQLGPL
jgi:hypothetical protein